ncbi:hypothetical protein Gxy13693_071_012 [Komagataeibacter xylinus NBRC 13693]|uniref:Uncharacterized protein n=2 Tax=Komagataeibacter TaxID=1434011 RepID=A0A0D6QBW7_KOMXY|nr:MULTISPECIES: hypothetical protein [Komagataeibacter]PYD79366.1 hypothetical protein CFR80_15325 [Komagataeibacter oboediens]GAO00920.1 hypothetical protein Gxy13693_071_012 [Komagataeibacter xylinus NBRC 13693]
MQGVFSLSGAVVSGAVATAAQKQVLGFARIPPMTVMTAGYISSFIFFSVWFYFRNRFDGQQATMIILVLLGISVIAALP